MDLEVRNAIIDKDPSSDPSCDGFSSSFYHCCWHIIRSDVVKAVQFTRIFRNWGLTLIFFILLPKVLYAYIIDKFRPIVIDNFFI